MPIDTLHGWNKLVNRGNDVFSVILMPYVLTKLLREKIAKIPTAKISKPTNQGDGTPSLEYQNHDVVTVTSEADAMALLKTFLALNIPNMLSKEVVEERQFQDYLSYTH